jgi:hypothetical protein
MPRFAFQVQPGRCPKPPAIEVLNDSEAAQKAALVMCADPASDTAGGLTEDSEWRLDVLTEAGKTAFRCRLLAETLEPTS